MSNYKPLKILKLGSEEFYLYQEKIPDHAGGYIYLVSAFKGKRQPYRTNFVAESGDQGLKGISQLIRYLEKRYGRKVMV